MSSKVRRVFLGLLWFICISNCCRCFPKHPQRIFCTRNVVFVGTVTQEILPTLANDFDIKYYFKLVSSFKSLINLIGSIVEVRVPSQGSLCGFRLTVGDTYLLSGFRNKKTKRISSSTCGNFHYKEGDITFQMMLYLFTIGHWSYKKNCSCKDIINPRFEPGTFDESKGCKIPPELNADLDCYDKTGLCKRQGTVCKWKNVDC